MTLEQGKRRANLRKTSPDSDRRCGNGCIFFNEEFQQFCRVWNGRVSQNDTCTGYRESGNTRPFTFALPDDNQLTAAEKETYTSRPVDTNQETHRPTETMQNNARRAQEWVKEFDRGGTETGRRRAAQIVRGDPISFDEIVEMNAWFARHEVDKKAEGFRAGEEGFPSNGRIAWDLWGGDSGQSWSRRIVERERREMETEQAAFKASVSGMARRETINGTQYLVVPVTAVVEGVMNGDLFMGNVLEATAYDLNGRPLIIDHPTNNNGDAETANTPDNAQSVIGTIYNVVFADNRLKGEAWINVPLTQSVGGDALIILRRAESGESLEVSIGARLFTTSENSSFMGTPYQRRVEFIQYDHLAVLPNDVGACSIQDGCGINQFKEDKTLFEKFKQFMKTFNQKEEKEPMSDETQPETVDSGQDAILSAVNAMQEKMTSQLAAFQSQLDTITQRQEAADNARREQRLKTLSDSGVDVTAFSDATDEQIDALEALANKAEQSVNTFSLNGNSLYSRDDTGEGQFTLSEV